MSACKVTDDKKEKWSDSERIKHLGGAGARRLLYITPRLSHDSVTKRSSQAGGLKAATATADHLAAASASFQVRRVLSVALCIFSWWCHGRRRNKGMIPRQVLAAIEFSRSCNKKIARPVTFSIFAAWSELVAGWETFHSNAPLFYTSFFFFFHMHVYSTDLSHACLQY